ncbi:tail completion protein gp17 [Sphingomonas sp. 22R3R2A-7]|uniref:tail completion protein gp17 n=1 Tax=Sphingomonas sp. 22R3R2A-7 TaxID=3050230 RepID=UPI002FE4107E
MSAGAVLQAGVVARLADVLDCAVFDAPPVRAAIPHAVVEDPVLGDWSSVTWRGREGRLVVTLHDGGERPVRLRAALGAAEAAVEGLDPLLSDGWRLVRAQLVRSRVLRVGERWRGTSEFLVRMYRED